MDILATWVHVTISTLFVLVCLLLILVILLQKGRGGGLAGAFGGGGGGHSAFGAKTGDVFTWVTVVLTFMFILTAVLGNYFYVPGGAGDSGAPTVEASPETPADSGETGTSGGGSPSEAPSTPAGG